MQLCKGLSYQPSSNPKIDLITLCRNGGFRYNFNHCFFTDGIMISCSIFIKRHRNGYNNNNNSIEYLRPIPIIQRSKFVRSLYLNDALNSISLDILYELDIFTKNSASPNIITSKKIFVPKNTKYLKNFEKVYENKNLNIDTPQESKNFFVKDTKEDEEEIEADNNFFEKQSL